MLRAAPPQRRLRERVAVAALVAVEGGLEAVAALLARLRLDLLRGLHELRPDLGESRLLGYGELRGSARFRLEPHGLGIRRFQTTATSAIGPI